MKHRSTWSANIQGKQKHNQIAYIYISIVISWTYILINVQLHDDMIFTSDHKMVVTTLDFSVMYKMKRGDAETRK